MAMPRPTAPGHPSSSDWTSSSQVAFRLDFEFSKSVFLHHLEIRLTAGRSGPGLLLLPPLGSARCAPLLCCQPQIAQAGLPPCAELGAPLLPSVPPPSFFHRQPRRK